MKPKQLLLTCLLVLVGSMAGQKAFAYDAKIGSIYYNFSGSEATVTYQKYDGSNYSSDYSGAIVIPKTVTYNGKTYRVTSIGDYAFYYCNDLTYITIPNSVTNIGIRAFSDCYALSSVSLPETVRTIGEAAFWSCINMKKVNIPKYITEIEPNCFYHCMALTSVTIPKGVTSIGYQAFKYCNNLATLICLPPTAPKFGDNVIAYTAADGVDIYVPAEGMTSYQNIGFKSDRRLHPMEVGSVLPSNKWSDAEYTVQTISYDSGVIYGNENESNPYYNKIVGVPDADANGKNWYDIDYSCNWEERTAPLNSWCQSGNYGDIYVRRTFYYDGNMPEELYLACGHDDAPCEYYLNGELIWSATDGWNDYFIHKLTEAQKVLLKPGQLNILAFHVHQNWGGMYADSGLYSSLEEMGISNECGDNLFWTFDEETKTLTITGTGDMYDFENTNSVPWYAYYVEIKHICIQPGATSIGSRAFAYANWNITDIVIPEGITRIGRNAFSDCYALSSVSLPETVRTIGEAAFWSCINMTEVNIPKLVTKIEPNCFYNCNALKSITIPSNVTSIGNGAFQYCGNLKNVWCYAGAVPSTGSNLFYGSPITSATLHVPEGSVEAYRTTAPWSSFGTIVAIEEPSPVIAFADANVKALCVAKWDTNGDGELSEKEAAAVTSLGNVFQGKTNINSFNELQYFTGLTSIGEKAFYGCTSLTSITIPGSVTSIGNNAFSGCSSLTSITIPNSVTSIGNYTFRDCSSLTSITIPGSVTSISNYAFSGCSSLASITIPSSVKSIGNYAFRDCTSLTSITIPGSVTSIGYNAFSGCSSLTSITIPNSVTSIGNYTFRDCSSLTSITIPGSVTSIGSNAFLGCSGLTSITIPSSVTSIGNEAFRNCSSLTSIKVESGNTTYDSRDNCNAIIETATNTLIAGCKDTTIPGSVTSIGGSAFSGCSGLTTITIPSSVTSIGNYAFRDCSGLTEVWCYAENVPTATNNAFSNYSATLHVPAGSVEAYSSTAPWSGFGTIVAIDDTPIIDFADANVKALCVAKWDTNGDGELSEKEAAAVTDLGEVFRYQTNITSFNELQNFTGLTSIGEYAFTNCLRLTSITIPESVTTIEKYAFWNCSSLVSATIPNSVTSINASAFRSCRSLNSINIPNSVTSIDRYVFSECSGLTSVTIPNSVTSIGYGAFSECSGLTSFTIPNSVTSIDGYAFGSCSSLTSITIPNSVTSIGVKVIGGCSSLTSIKVEESNPKYNSHDNCNAIIETATNTLIAGCKNTTIPNSVTSIGESAFEECSSLTSITIPNSVTSIGFAAFMDCSGLTSITIPNSVTNIDGYAFGSCSSLTSITLPESLTSIGYLAFMDCSGLTDVWCYAASVPMTTGSDVFDFSLSSATLHVPAASFIAYSTTAPWSSFGTIVPIDGFVINDETTSFSIVAKESGKAVVLTHQFTGDWESLCLPFVIDYEAIRADFDLAEIDGIVQNDDNYDGIADITVLSIMGFKEQMTTPNTPYLIRAKKAGEQTIIVEEVTIYPTVSGSIDCSSTSTRYEFTGTYNSLNASALANSYVVQDGELVKGASSLAPCRWYMTATARKGSLNLPNRIRIMPVEDVITGVETLSDSPLKGEDIYNLAGQRLQKMQKGINIMNGKKILR